MNSVQIYVFVVHGILEGLLSAAGMGLVGWFVPAIFNRLDPAAANTDALRVYAFRTFSALNVALGAMLWHHVWRASFHEGYEGLREFASWLCLADALYSLASLPAALDAGYWFLLPLALDVPLLISKVCLFVFNLAEKYYKIPLLVR